MISPRRATISDRIYIEIYFSRYRERFYQSCNEIFPGNIFARGTIFKFDFSKASWNVIRSNLYLIFSTSNLSLFNLTKTINKLTTSNQEYTYIYLKKKETGTQSSQTLLNNKHPTTRQTKRQHFRQLILITISIANSTKKLGTSVHPAILPRVTRIREWRNLCTCCTKIEIVSNGTETGEKKRREEEKERERGVEKKWRSRFTASFCSWDKRYAVGCWKLLCVW